jgi:hypothetical protein
MAEKETPIDLITQKKAAEITGRSIAAINNLIQRGRLKTITQHDKRLVSRSEVLGLKRLNPGRKKNANT